MNHGMLELTDQLGMDYYFVSLKKEGNTLFIQSLNSYCKAIHKEVQLAEIEGLIIEESAGLGYVCFDYNKEHFHFVEYGNQILPFFKAILFPATLHP
ncbi:hypothetical protein [Enterococcus sp. UD-01]|jgi:hypothetical protein|uniref:hypothetical protein n=1 Tax=Enterococcus sp. UD-01 TaxID=3373911 RepID=UPI003832AD5D